MASQSRNLVDPYAYGIKRVPSDQAGGARFLPGHFSLGRSTWSEYLNASQSHSRLAGYQDLNEAAGLRGYRSVARRCPRACSKPTTWLAWLYLIASRMRGLMPLLRRGGGAYDNPVWPTLE
jgi:hypothetical protein